MATASAPLPSLLASPAPQSILTLFLASSTDSQDADAGTTDNGDDMDAMDAMDGVTTATTTETAEESAAEAAIRAQGMDGILLSGTTVRTIRRKLGVSAAMLAEHIGYSRSRVHAWEAGEEIPPAMYLPILRYLGQVRTEREEWRKLAEQLRKG